MFRRLFPKQIDNTYRGLVIALWLLAPLVIVKFLMGLNVAGLNPWVDNRYILQSVDQLPLDTYGAQAASAAVFLFSCWGLALLLLSSLGALALVRYRAAIPLIYLVLSIEQIGRKGLSLIHPFVRAVEPGSFSPGVIINWALTAALVIGLVLSLVAPRADRVRGGG